MTMAEQPASVSLAKASLRCLIGERLRGIDAGTRRGWDEAICAFVARSAVFELAQTVIGYFALPDEVNIDALLAAAIEEGKHVFVPAVRDREMQFTRWTPRAAVRRSDHHVLEAATQRGQAREMGPSLMLVPGRAFDAAGGRVGRGGGYYDRALAPPLHDTRVVGVGYALQLVDTVPVATHDRRVEMIFTENGCVMIPDDELNPPERSQRANKK